MLVLSKKTDDIAIQRGVGQGCFLSPLLFNLYSEQIFKKALEDIVVDINMNEILINNIRYADDSLLLAETLEDLKTLFNVINHNYKIYEHMNIRTSIKQNIWLQT